ncbi:MAG: putative glycoside hydrolase [Spirochaetota bacterium]
MNKKCVALLSSILLFSAFTGNTAFSDDTINLKSEGKKDTYKFPQFYKGIYLNVYSARNMDRLTGFMEKAKKNRINTLVLDVQTGKADTCAVSQEIVSHCVKNGFHPVARIVVFPDGLSHYPVTEEFINGKLNIAEAACINGFKEIQFDYIRFSDIRVSKRLTFAEKYAFIESFFRKARARVEKYNTKIAADVFGRIPLNQDDGIGQKMEVFDKVVDIICPMAYPSHYTWSAKLMADPYHTVFITSKSAKERSKKAEIVTYIQAFQMKVGKSNLTFDKYIEVQLKAVHDSGVRGYILWNASQNYDVAFRVLGKYYREAQEAANLNTKDKSS